MALCQIGTRGNLRARAFYSWCAQCVYIYVYMYVYNVCAEKGVVLRLVECKIPGWCVCVPVRENGLTKRVVFGGQATEMKRERRDRNEEREEREQQK